MLVAENTLERGVNGLRRMAVDTGIPYPRSVPVSAADREPGVRKEDRRLPGERTVTRAAIRLEPRRLVVRVRGGQIILQMTRNALHRRAPVAVVYMTGSARDSVMDSPGGEPRQPVVKARLPRDRRL